jgi:hypothetical protein
MYLKIKITDIDVRTCSIVATHGVPHYYSDRTVLSLTQSVTLFLYHVSFTRRRQHWLSQFTTLHCPTNS